MGLLRPHIRSMHHSRATGEVRRAQIFVATLGASNFTYAEARWTQALPDWIGCHVGAFSSFGGVTRQIVCGNLKAGVTAACRYEPGISRTYQDMASHYGTAVLPARVRRPRDKAKVEVAVQVVQRWVLARLRHRRFFSLAELNGAIRELVTDLNDRPMRHLATSRRIEQAGVGDRVSTLAWDVAAAPPPCRYDAAVVKSVIQVLSPGDARALLRHVGQAMEPGGHIFIVGQHLDDSCTSPPLTVGMNLVFLNIYDDGLAYTEGEHREWLTEAGFADITLSPIQIPNGVRLITARKV